MKETLEEIVIKKVKKKFKPSDANFPKGVSLYLEGLKDAQIQFEAIALEFRKFKPKKEYWLQNFSDNQIWEMFKKNKKQLFEIPKI